MGGKVDGPLIVPAARYYTSNSTEPFAVIVFVGLLP